VGRVCRRNLYGAFVVCMRLSYLPSPSPFSPSLAPPSPTPPHSTRRTPPSGTKPISGLDLKNIYTGQVERDGRTFGAIFTEVLKQVWPLMQHHISPPSRSHILPSSPSCPSPSNPTLILLRTQGATRFEPSERILYALYLRADERTG